MTKIVCPLCGSDIDVCIPDRYVSKMNQLRGAVVCSNDDCRPVDSRVFGEEDCGMTKAVMPFFVSSSFFELSKEMQEEYCEMLRKSYADMITQRYVKNGE